MSLIDRILAGRHEPGELESFLDGVFAGTTDPVVLAGVLVALRTQPITADLLVSGARAMRNRCTRVQAPTNAIDTCGTGGDGSGTVNISTAAALVVASLGVPVAKHGNRAASSRCGSADVLEALGFSFPDSAEAAESALRACGFAFLMAPLFHPGARHAAPVRRALGVRTLFNLLGPLANPAFVARQVVGVYDPVLTEPFARALGALGAERALVVHGAGLDELALHADTHGHLWEDGDVQAFSWRGVGVPVHALQGGDATENAAILRNTLEGRDGPVRQAVALNAGAALWIAGCAPRMEEGIELARERLAAGIDLRALGASP